MTLRGAAAAVLEVEGLCVDIATPRGALHAVRDVSMRVDRGETLCLVGESGCGKSVTALAIMGLLPRTARRRVTRLRVAGVDLAAASARRVNELRGNRYKLQSKIRIMGDDITCGADILGALLMGHAYNAWWVGSDLSIEESRRLVPHQNATTMQVAISVVSAAHWMIENPARGVLVPDDLPHEYILKLARPYLGKNLSVQSDWTPLKAQYNEFDGFNKPELNRKDPWQFQNFLITD